MLFSTARVCTDVSRKTDLRLFSGRDFLKIKIILAIQQDHRQMNSFELKKHESP